jgi:hypothetical protein
MGSKLVGLAVLLGGLLAAAVPGPLSADVLVTRDGQRIETRGPWEVKGRMVVFTLPNGTLSSIRADEVDLAASREATAEALAPVEEPEPAEEKPREPVLRLTTRDVGYGDAGAQGPEALLERLRAAHEYQDRGAALGLVNWQNTPEPIRDFMEKEFDVLMERQIDDIRLTEVAPGENLQQIQDGVTYRPNVEVTHRLEIDFVPETGEDRESMSLYVGTLLGSYFIAAAEPVEEYEE